jgi:hypothetical protein
LALIGGIFSINEFYTWAQISTNLFEDLFLGDLNMVYFLREGKRR